MRCTRSRRIVASPAMASRRRCSCLPLLALLGAALAQNQDGNFQLTIGEGSDWPGATGMAYRFIDSIPARAVGGPSGGWVVGGWAQGASGVARVPTPAKTHPNPLLSSLGRSLALSLSLTVSLCTGCIHTVRGRSQRTARCSGRTSCTSTESRGVLTLKPLCAASLRWLTLACVLRGTLVYSSLCLSVCLCVSVTASPCDCFFL